MGSLETPLPEEKLPACWSDDTRMNALFAPCRHRTIAPEGWQQKMTFWSEQLRSWCRHRRSPLVSLSAARAAFSRNRNRPACLDVVLDQYIRSGEYVPASSYANALSGAGEGWVRWGARVAFKPAALAVGLLTSWLPLDRTPHDGMATANIDHDELYVNQVVVKELALELLASFPESRERVGTLEELMESAGYAPAERQTFEIVLGYMLTADLAIRKGELYKLADAGGGKVQPVSECEQALHRLQTAERRLTADVDKFRAEEESALVDTRNALRLDNKTLAKSHLRRKHRSAGRAADTEAALDNVRRILLEMRQAEFNSSIVGAYKMSAGAMKRAMKEKNLDEDTAHETMDELREVLETYSAVERSLAGGALEEVDAAELEDELEVLLASEPRGGAAGGTPERPARPADRRRDRTEKEFVFDGEERMIAELNELSLPELGEPRAGARAAGQRAAGARGKVAAPAGGWDGSEGKPDVPKPRAEEPEPTKPTKEWYPPADESLSESIPESKGDLPWALKKIENLESMGANYSLEALSNSMSELRTDPRLHPGQKLNPNSSSTGHILYNTDFQVQDHRLDDGVWIFNANDDDRNQSYSERNQSYASRHKSHGNRKDSDVNRNQEHDNRRDDRGKRSDDRDDRNPGYIGRTVGQGGRGYNERNENYGDRNQNYSNSSPECGSPKQSYGDRNQDFSERNQRCSERNQSYSERNQDSTCKSKKDRSVDDIKRRNISEDFTNSTEYSELSDGNSGTDHRFQMAPGGERPSRQEPWSDEDEERNMQDLERRLKNLRSFNL